MMMNNFKFSKMIVLITTIFILLVDLSVVVKAKLVENSQQTQLPQTCRADCVTPYGQILGVTSGNVVAYSNCKNQCVIFEPHYQNGTYTGIKWQCVEFARRWLLIHKEVVYGDVDFAVDIWDKIDFVTRVTDNKQFQLESHLNGSTQPPQIGDLLIYAKAFLKTGHVAIVTDIDLKAGIIQVAEQNFFNLKWAQNYAREIEIVEKKGKYWLLEGYLLGWKHILFGKE
jgi:glutathionylspermidine amidase/synthetase